MSTLLERELYAWTRVAWDKLPAGLRRRAIPLAQKGFRLRLSLASSLERGLLRPPVFVVATMRSGSNLLCDLLDAHPEIRMLGEGLNPRTRYGVGNLSGNPDAALNHLHWLFGRCPNTRPAAKLLADQLALHRLRVAEVAQTFPEARWIVLYRRSLIRQLISLKRATATGRFVSVKSRDSQLRPPLVIGRDELLQFCQEMRDTYREIMTQLAPCRPLVLQYEHLAREPQRLFDERIWDFLQLPSVPVTTRLEQQSSGSLREMVAELEAVQDLVDSPATQLDLEQQGGLSGVGSDSRPL